MASRGISAKEALARNGGERPMCNVHPDVAMRWNKRADYRDGGTWFCHLCYLGSKELVHGRISTYTTYRCRCDLCREAGAEYQRSHKKKAQRRFSCSVLGCEEEQYASGMCRRHYNSHHNKGTLSSVDRKCKRCDRNKVPYGEKFCGECEIWLAREKKLRINARQRGYKLTLEQYDQMVEDQCGMCPVCERYFGTDLCVDHDHDTHEVRGLLCSVCNAGIGFLGDRLHGVLRAARYLGYDPNSSQVSAGQILAMPRAPSKF